MRDVHQDIREIIAETRPQPAGSARWWGLVTATLDASARQADYEEHGPPADCRRRAGPALRDQLARRWRAFGEAWIRDQSYPDAVPDIRPIDCRCRTGGSPWPFAGGKVNSSALAAI